MPFLCEHPISLFIIKYFIEKNYNKLCEIDLQDR